MSIETIQSQLLTVPEFAAHCGIGVSTVWRWLAAKTIRSWKPPHEGSRVPGKRFRRVRIHRRELERVLSRTE
jgi:hypothetical protein